MTSLEEWSVTSGLIQHIPCVDFVENFADGVMCYFCGKKPPQEILDAALFGGDIEIPRRIWTREKCRAINRPD